MTRGPRPFRNTILLMEAMNWLWKEVYPNWPAVWVGGAFVVVVIAIFAWGLTKYEPTEGDFWPMFFIILLWPPYWIGRGVRALWDAWDGRKIVERG